MLREEEHAADVVGVASHGVDFPGLALALEAQPIPLTRCSTSPCYHPFATA